MEGLNPTSEEIQNALTKTGFLFEQQAYQFLQGATKHLNTESENREFYAQLGDLYPDPDTGKSREMDIIGTYSNWAGDYRLGAPYVSASLIIECKNASAPYVILGGKNTHAGLIGTASFQLLNDPLRYDFPKAKHELMYGRLELAKIAPGPLHVEVRGSQLLRLNRAQGNWKADNSGVQDSILYPLAKATNYLRERNVASITDPMPEFYFYFPIILINAPVYTVLVENKEISVQEVHWGTVVRQFEEPNLKGTFVFEVVNFEWFGEYIKKRLVTFVDGIERTLINNMRYFDPDWCLANLGEPRLRPEFDIWWAAFAENRKL